MAIPSLPEYRRDDTPATYLAHVRDLYPKRYRARFDRVIGWLSESAPSPHVTMELTGEQLRIAAYALRVAIASRKVETVRPITVDLEDARELHKVCELTCEQVADYMGIPPRDLLLARDLADFGALLRQMCDASSLSDVL